MTMRVLISAVIALGTLAAATVAQASSCSSGGTLTITAASDSLSLTPTPATTFNFGEHVILTAAATDFTIATYAWTIDGPAIKDYNDDLGTKDTPTPAAPLAWSTTPLVTADLAQASVDFYWTPSTTQIEPNNGPFTRNVTLTVKKSRGGTCSVTQAFAVERTMTDSNRQPEDFYTSNHRAPTTTNPQFGHVIDEHMFWHQSVHDLTSFPVWTRFLAWHGTLMRRFDSWRQTFGYKPVDPWYPGRPLPTGPKFDVDPALRAAAYLPQNNRIPTYFTIIGGVDSNAGRKKLADYPTLDAFTASFEATYHGQVHCNIGSHTGTNFGTSGPGFGSMCNTSSPKDPMFWRWHGFIDVLYRNYCALHAGACSNPSPADPASYPWIADNFADTGTLPSSPPRAISPDVWNRRAQVTTEACVSPPDANGNLVTTGGVVRNCGTSADHQNPVTGIANFLYGTLRNTRPGPARTVYAEIGVYYATGSTGITFPTNFTFVPESRQSIVLHLEPNTTTAFGPIPWTPPPVLADPTGRYSLYLRVFSVQQAPPTEGQGLDTDVGNSNDLAWRTIKVVPAGDTSLPTF
jgi:hypothetical protein